MRSLGLLGCLVGSFLAGLGCERQPVYFKADPILAEATRRADRGSGWFTRLRPSAPPSRRFSLADAGLGGVVEVDVAGRTAMVASRELEVPDAERVIGVVLEGRPRAYLLSSFEVHAPTVPEDLAGHVLVDTTGSQPLCVTYCDRTRTTRVLRSTLATESMPEVRVGGWNRGLTLLVEGKRHRQDDRELPLLDVDFKLITWGEWRTQYPHSELIRHAVESGESP